MKKIKYIICSIALLTILSCGDDDFSRAYVDDEVKTVLTGQLNLSRIVSAPGLKIGFTFTLPQSFDVESKVEVTATTYDFKQSKAFVTVPAGQTSGSGTITMPGTGTVAKSFFGINDFVTVQLTGVALKQPETGPTIEDPYTLSSDGISVRFIDRDPDWMRILSARSLVLSLDWANPAENDLDLYVYNSVTGAYIEASETGSRWEGDFIDDGHPDGVYYVEVGFWSVTGDNIPYSIHCLRNDETVDYYEGVFQSPVSRTYLSPILVLTKTTVNGSAYITTSLP
ncbi:hypothetical protein NA63_1347 [Flavobacteriaceae bacterium MAR_2010_105]|nr:hypothetical protein NA63_1347 [Flavobacteriaceae bacterium MAR_2010_105]